MGRASVLRFPLALETLSEFCMLGSLLEFSPSVRLTLFVWTGISDFFLDFASVFRPGLENNGLFLHDLCRALVCGHCAYFKSLASIFNSPNRVRGSNVLPEIQSRLEPQNRRIT